MLEKLNQFINLFVETGKQIGQGKIWLVLLLLSGLSAIVLWAHIDFLSSAFYPVISWWTELVSDSAARAFSHYPGQYLALPFYFGLARLLPGLVFEGLLLGWAAILFRRAFLPGAHLPTSFKYISRRWFHLTGCWVVVNGLFMLVSMYLPDLLEFFHQNSPRRMLAVELVVVPFVLTIILALFYFALASVAIEELSLLQGIGRSIRLFLRRPFTAFFLAGIVMAGPFLLTTIASRSADIVDKFRPEMVAVILFVGLGVELIANFVWMGTAVRFLLEEQPG